MTTPTPLAETIARVAHTLESENVTHLWEPAFRDAIATLLSCARRCEAIERVNQTLPALREYLEHKDSAAIVTKGEALSLLDAALEERSERDALVKRVGELERFRSEVLQASIPGNADDLITDNAIAYQVVNLRRCTDAWLATIRSQEVTDVDDEDEHARALAKADEVLSELDTLRAEAARLRTENERLRDELAMWPDDVRKEDA